MLGNFALVLLLNTLVYLVVSDGGTYDIGVGLLFTQGVLIGLLVGILRPISRRKIE
jgi:hypothetical protein